MSLFDMADPEKETFADESFPDLPDFRKEEILAYEKEVLGIYISGHPLDAYDLILEKNVTATSADFLMEEESEGDADNMTPSVVQNENRSNVADGDYAVIGGIITAKNLKTTKSNSMMAFLTVEDLYGTIEVLVFPKDFEKRRGEFEIDKKVLIRGRVSTEDERGSKLLFSDMKDLDSLELKLWIKMPDEETYLRNEQELLVTICEYDGNDKVVVYTEKDKQCRVLPDSKTTDARDPGLIERLVAAYGAENVKTTAPAIKWETGRR